MPINTNTDDPRVPLSGQAASDRGTRFMLAHRSAYGPLPPGVTSFMPVPVGTPRPHYPQLYREVPMDGMHGMDMVPPPGPPLPQPIIGVPYTGPRTIPVPAVRRLPMVLQPSVRVGHPLIHQPSPLGSLVAWGSIAVLFVVAGCVWQWYLRRLDAGGYADRGGVGSKPR